MSSQSFMSGVVSSVSSCKWPRMLWLLIIGKHSTVPEQKGNCTLGPQQGLWQILDLEFREPWLFVFVFFFFCKFISWRRTGTSLSLTSFFLWHPKVVPASMAGIHSIPLCSEVLMGLRTGPESLTFVMCNEIYTVCSSRAPMVCVHLAWKSRRVMGENRIELGVPAPSDCGWRLHGSRVLSSPGSERSTCRSA